MLHDELLRPLPGQTLAHLACIVGGEGALAVQLGIPVGSGCFHLGIRGCKALLFCHQQKPQPAAQLALCLRVEPCTELFHRLAAHFKELVKVDAIGLQAQVELALLGKIVTAHQLLWQRAFHCIAQLPYQLLACPLLSLGTALCPDLAGHLLPQRRLARCIGCTFFVAVVTVDLQFNGQLPDGVRLNGLHETGVCSHFQRRKRVELRPRPEALGPVHRQQFKIRVGHRHHMVLLHQLLIQRRKAAKNGAIHRLGQQTVLFLRRVRLRLHLCNGCRQFLGTGCEYQTAVARLSHAKMFQFHPLFPFQRAMPTVSTSRATPITAYSTSAPSVARSPSTYIFSGSSGS